MKKVKGIFIVIVIAAAIFGILVAIESNAVSKYERVDMAVAVKEVPKGTKLTEENVREYFVRLIMMILITYTTIR